MRNGTILTTLAALAIASGTGCGEAKWAPTAEQQKLMNGQLWVYDRAASEKLRNEVVKDTTSITADIELKGDVGAMADFLTDTKLFFALDKKSGKAGWQRITGSGILESKSSGWMEWQGDKTFVLKGFDTKDGKKIDVSFEIKEISEKRTILHKAGAAFPEIYTTG
jgi:hypothetical protein